MRWGVSERCVICGVMCGVMCRVLCGVLCGVMHGVMCVVISLALCCTIDILIIFAKNSNTKFIVNKITKIICLEQPSGK